MIKNFSHCFFILYLVYKLNFKYKNDLKPKIDSRKLRTEDSDIFIRHGIAIEILKKINSHPKFKSFEKIDRN